MEILDVDEKQTAAYDKVSNLAAGWPGLLQQDARVFTAALPDRGLCGTVYTTGSVSE